MFMVSASVIIGCFLGFIFKNHIFFDVNLIIKFGLYFLLFVIGLDIGRNKSIFKNLKNLNKKIILLPIITIIASLLGGAVASFFIKMPIGESIAISSGMGWYSFSAIELSKISAELGSLSFLSNMFRELLALLFIPFVSKKITPLAAVSMSGAPAMDSVLPIINKHNTSDISIISFYSGLVISILVPLLVPTVVNIFIK